MDPVDRAIRAIDAANAADPGVVEGEPLALVEGRLADGWLERLSDDPSDALRLAARAHHLRRWVVPRSSYPDGRAGYLRWRRDQKSRHATELTAILDDAGVESEIAERAAVIVTKAGLGTDPEVQVFEDAVCLTFLRTQLSSTADRLDDDHMVRVIAKTLAKMSDRATQLASEVPMDEHATALLARAVAESA
jgi:hypothetical protein